MTVDRAAELVLKAHPHVEIVSAHDYRGDYLFVAPDKKLGILGDYNDPYYVVDKRTGEVRAITPLEDFAGFDEAFSKKQLELTKRTR